MSILDIFRRNRPSRAERQARNLARCLFWVSLVLLAVTVAMTSRFGWNLGVTLADKFLYATGNGAIDVVGALIMAGCGVCFARKAYIAGSLSVIGACVCILLSGIAIFGFLASNRSAVAHHVKKIEQTDANQLDWLRNQTIAKGASTQQKETFFSGVKDQIREIKSALPQLPDAQAEDLAKMAGVSEDEMRRYLTLVATGSILFCQFACLGLYGFIRHGIEPQIAKGDDRDAGGDLNQPSEEKKPPKKQALPDLRPKTTQKAAYDDLKQMLKGGVEIPSQAMLARRWGVSEVTVHTWLGKWPEFHRDPAETGRRNRIVLAHANGNGRILTQ